MAETYAFEAIMDRLIRARAWLAEAEQEYEAHLYWEGSIKDAEKEIRGVLEDLAGLIKTHSFTER